jgi:DNA-binding MarR family transcriptional regulator
VTDSGGWPGEDTAETQVMALTPAQRQVLAALAVVGRASLSAEELAELVEVGDVAPLVDDLERRGLITRDERRRYSAVGRVGEGIRRTDEAAASADRLLGYMTTLAKGGELTPARLVEDAEAILGLSEWAAEHREWAALLELVKTLQACFGIAHRVHDWLTLLERGRSAAAALGDERSEVWLLQQLATASTSAGDTQAAQRYLREADDLQRARRPDARRATRTDETLPGGSQAALAAGGGARRALWIASLLIVGAGGIGAGYAIGNDSGDVGVTTAPVSITVTIGGRTVTTSDTVTLPATTVLSATTEVTTTTETTTVTTTTTVTAGVG